VCNINFYYVLILKVKVKYFCVPRSNGNTISRNRKRVTEKIMLSIATRYFSGPPNPEVARPINM